MTSNAVDNEGKELTVEKRLDVGNTAKKFLLDQTVGATINTVLFTAVISALKGSSGVSIVDAIKQVRMECRSIVDDDGLPNIPQRMQDWLIM